MEETAYLMSKLESFNLTKIKEEIENFYLKKCNSISELEEKTGYYEAEVRKFLNDVKEFTESHQVNSEISNSELSLLKDYVKKVCYKFHIGKNKKAVLILGLPGSGKSTIEKSLCNIYSDNFLSVDADFFKFGDLENGLSPLVDYSKRGLDVETIHEKSSNLARYELEILSNNDYCITVPKVGSSIESIHTIIANLKEKQYKIFVHFVFVSVETALKRNLSRFNLSRQNNNNIRLVKPDDIIKAGYKPLINFFRLIEENNCDSFTLWDGENYSVPTKILEI